MALYFDLDGVLREFGSYVLGGEPDRWDATNQDGKTVIQIVNEHPEICLECPETEYLGVVNELLDRIVILSNQLPLWAPYTSQWLNNHIEIPYQVIYTSGPDEKLRILKSSDVIIEDYPKFRDYSQVALISRDYNKHLNVPLRISNARELESFLLSFDDIYYRNI